MFIYVQIDRKIDGQRDRQTDVFWSNTVFNLSGRVLKDIEIKVIEKGLDFAPIQNKINEPELRSDFKNFHEE